MLSSHSLNLSTPSFFSQAHSQSHPLQQRNSTRNDSSFSTTTIAPTSENFSSGHLRLVISNQSFYSDKMGILVPSTSMRPFIIRCHIVGPPSLGRSGGCWTVDYSTFLKILLAEVRTAVCSGRVGGAVCRFGLFLSSGLGSGLVSGGCLGARRRLRV